jgi:hypothetical protein
MIWTEFTLKVTPLRRKKFYNIGHGDLPASVIKLYFSSSWTWLNNLQEFAAESLACVLDQETLTEGESPIQLISSLR